MAKRIEFFGIRVNEWTLARDCELEPRQMRHAVSAFNDAFGIDENHKYYILSGNRGYMLTQDLRKIRKAIERDQGIAVDRINQLRNRMNRLVHRENCIRHGVKHA